MKKIFLFSLLTIFFLFTAKTMASSYTLELGWNLVSADILFALGEDKNHPDQVFREGALFGLNPKDKQYYGGAGTRQNVERGLEKITPVLPHGDESVSALGFWLYFPRSLSLDVNFNNTQSIEKKYETTTYQFIKGWNLIGITGLMQGKSLINVKGSCDFASVYNFEKGQWHKQSDADLREIFTTDSLGHALAVKVITDCAFDFKESKSASQIPKLPE